MEGAKLYDEQFAKTLPFDWEMSVLSKHLGSVKTLLDVGCGTGRHVVPLAKRNLQVLGIDADKEYLRTAREKLTSERLAANTDLIMADARRLPLNNALFEAVICMGNVLGDINVRKNDRAAVIKEMIEAARPKAIFIVEFVHRYWKPTDLLIWFYRYLTTCIEKVRGKPTEYGDCTEAIKANHRTIKLTFHAFTTREARRLFANQGFQTKIEKRAKFFHDWFIVVATTKSKINEAP